MSYSDSMGPLAEKQMARGLRGELLLIIILSCARLRMQICILAQGDIGQPTVVSP